jgi:hypothetical protein
MRFPNPGGFGMFGGIFSDILAGLVFIICFVIVVGLLVVLVRFLWIATRAAEIYIANNSSRRIPLWLRLSRLHQHRLRELPQLLRQRLPPPSRYPPSRHPPHRARQRPTRSSSSRNSWRSSSSLGEECAQ